MRDGSAGVADGGNLPFQKEFRPVFTVVDGLAEERLTEREGLPKRAQHGFVGARPLQNPGCFPEDFGSGVTRHIREGRIDEENSWPGQVKLRVCGHDGLPGLFHGGASRRSDSSVRLRWVMSWARTTT